MELDGWVNRGYQRHRRCAGAALGARKRPVLAASSSSVASPAALAPHTPGAGPEASCKRDDPRPTSGSERGRRRPGVFSNFQVRRVLFHETGTRRDTRDALMCNDG